MDFVFLIFWLSNRRFMDCRKIHPHVLETGSSKYFQRAFGDIISSFHPFKLVDLHESSSQRRLAHTRRLVAQRSRQQRGGFLLDPPPPLRPCNSSFARGCLTARLATYFASPRSATNGNAGVGSVPG